MRQTAPQNGPFGNATWPIWQCNTARKTAKTSPYSNAICGSSDHATRQMSQPASAPLPKIHGTLSPQTIFRAFPFVLISKKTRPRRRRRSPQPKTKSSADELSRNTAQTPTATCAYGHGHAQRRQQAYNSRGKKNPLNFLFN